MKDGLFRSLLDLFMVSDPWPCTEEGQEIIEEMLDKEAKRRGYETWVHAFHNLDYEWKE